MKQEEQFFRRRLLQLGKKEVLAGHILICPWILILTNDNFAGKEEAADFYSFQGELVACLCVLSVIIITIIVNIANVMKIAVTVVVADNKYFWFDFPGLDLFHHLEKEEKLPAFLPGQLMAPSLKTSKRKPHICHFAYTYR